MNVLITGGSGFMGSHFIRYLLLHYGDVQVVNLDKLTYAASPERLKDVTKEFGNRYLFLEGDIADSPFIDKLFKKLKPAVIVDFAAETHVDRSILEPASFVKTDVIGTYTLLEAARTFSVKLFIKISSLTGDMPVLVKYQDRIELLSFSQLEKQYKAGYSVLSLDKDYTHRFLPIKKFIKHRIKGVYTISYTGGTIKTSSSHSVFTFSRETGEVVLKEVRDLREGDYLVTLLGRRTQVANNLMFDLNTYKRGDNYAPYPKDQFLVDEELMWCAGFYVAEGYCFTHKTKKIQKVTLTQKYPQKLEQFSNILYRRFGFTFPVRERKDKTGFRMEITRQPLCGFFHEFGGNAYTKRLPSWMWETSSSFVRAFLAGYAGDAHIRPDGARNYTSVNKDLVTQVAWLCRLHNINCRINQRICRNNQGLFIGSKKRNLTMYDLTISAEEFFYQHERWRTPFSRCLPIKPTYYHFRTKSNHFRVKYNNIIGKAALASAGVSDPIVKGDVGVAKITKITFQDQEVIMYDLEVPGTQSFFSGTVPVLAHNTDEVYGSIEKGKFTEESPFKPNSPYSASKAGGDLLCRAYVKTYGLPLIVTHFCNFFGPWQHPEKFIPLFITNLLENKKVPLYGNGRNAREWIYVEDVARALDLLIQKGVPGEVYNIGTHHEKENWEIATFIIQKLGKDGSSIVNVNDRPGHDFRYALNWSKMKKLGFTPKYSFERGLKETVEWYKKNRSWWEKIKQSEEFQKYYKRQYPSL